MTIETLKSQLPDYAKDIRLNLSGVLSETGAPDLTPNQIYGIALASAYATKHQAVIEAVSEEAANVLSAEEVEAAKAAATVMAMNNVYYRFIHLVSDKQYGTMPAKLRMNVIGSPGIPKVDFELYALAVSAINGCGMCMDAHVREVTHGGITALGVQSTVRIAAVISAAAQGITIAEQNAALVDA